MPSFIHRSCASASSRRPGARTGSTRSSSTAIACSCASQDGEARHAHAQGARLDRQVRRHRRCCAATFPTASSTARWWRSTTTARRISRRCRRRSREGRSRDLIYFVFDLLFDDGEDLRALAADRAQGAAQEAARAARERIRPYQISSSTSQSPAMPCSSRPAVSTSKASSPSAPSAPYESGRTETWHKSKCRGGQEVVIGGWSGSASNLRSLLVGVYRGGHLVHTGRVGTGFNQRNAGEPSQEAQRPQRPIKSPFGGKGAPRKAQTWTWVKPKLVAEIEFAGWTGDGNGAPGCLQGPARGQAGAARCAPRRPRRPTKRRATAALSPKRARRPHQGRQRRRHGRRRSQSPTSRCGLRPKT